MKHLLLRGALSIVIMAISTACIDDSYDLSDIDTTSEFQVKDLVLPINIDPVTLGDIIEIKEDDNIKVVELNGQTFYAVKENGTFSSDPINIPGFIANVSPLNSTQMRFDLSSSFSTNRVNTTNSTATVDLAESVNQPLNFKASNIDKSIKELTDIYTNNFNIKIEFSVSPLVTNMADIALSNLHLEIPKGLTISNLIPGECLYNEGNLEVPSLQFEEGKAYLSLNASAINLPANNSGIDFTTHELMIDTKIDIVSAQLIVAFKNSAYLDILSNIYMDVNYSVSQIDVNAISGKIQYNLEGKDLNIPAISLENLPEFLANDETNLILANPQIYLSINNPVANKKIGYQSGLRITAIREKTNNVFEINNGYFRVGYDNGIVGPYNFCFAPHTPEVVPSNYENPELVEFSNLGDILAGNGLPESIKIDLVSPQIYEQTVEQFELNQDFPSLSGNWEFLAPLALNGESGAKIVYTDTVDGWGSEDLDKLTITVLEVKVNVTNDTPLSASLSGYPIDKDGNQISSVIIEGAEIPGGAKDSPVTLRITGEVKDLDGIRFTAMITPTSNEALSPKQSITLSNIKAKVSGNYITDF